MSGMYTNNEDMNHELSFWLELHHGTFKPVLS